MMLRLKNIKCLAKNGKNWRIILKLQNMSKGRGNRNAITVGEATKLDLHYLLKNKYIQKGKKVTFNLSWANGSNMSCESFYSTNDIYVRLCYTITDNYTKEKTSHDYKIYISKVKSNLGKGEVLLFVCPESARYCRTLFMCYGSQRFKHRLAYSNRIYYNTQTSSKLHLNTDRYFAIDKKINKLSNKRDAINYKGKTTKRHEHTINLFNKRNELDELRSIDLNKWLSNHYGFNL